MNTNTQKVQNKEEVASPPPYPPKGQWNSAYDKQKKPVDRLRAKRLVTLWRRDTPLPRAGGKYVFLLLLLKKFLKARGGRFGLKTVQYKLKWIPWTEIFGTALRSFGC
ncbi:hypothetical protein CDAR_310111 [Caerostris darwini]|uniref:Uncharacterized protein n=1 Tax=Caerostris darwini TaxID=1538125 RepID=A0AAV4WRQ1_9ARAC|nr:hypothetical protein CDAR_310111 [Caerostris darwini]